MSPAHDTLVALIPRLRRYARVLCGDRASADDLVQDTLERACARLAQWTPGTDLRAWVFTIMHNLFVSETRRPRHRFEQQLDEQIVPDRPDSLGDPAIAWGAALDLERALRLLPDSQLQVILLVALEGMSYEQVADATGVPVGTVMSRLFRARERLHALLDAGTGGHAANGPRLKVLK